MSVLLRSVHRDEFLTALDAVLFVYREAIGCPPEMLGNRRSMFIEHAGRAGFRAVFLIEELSGAVCGFAYGHHSQRGQWWHNCVASGLSPDMYGFWFHDAFELAELHVLPDFQGRGAGFSLMSTLLGWTPGSEPLPERTVVLSTPEVDGESSRAFRLYRRCGFQDVRRQLIFPGDGRLFAVLGRRAADSTTPPVWQSSGSS